MQPEIYIPGRTKAAKPGKDRSNKEYPKMVYTAGLADWVIINSPEEWPDGYYAHAEAAEMDAVEVEEEKEVDEDALSAEKAKREAKKAQKEYRKGIMDYLDEYHVEFARNVSTEKLEELKVALDEHLAGKDQPDDNELNTDNGGVSGS